MMNTEAIRTFLSLAATKSFTKTAQELMVVQSTVSARVKELEKTTGHRLFQRDTGGVSLTLQGQIFLEYAQRMLSLQEGAIAEINMLALYSGILKLATPHILFDTYVCSLTGAFMKHHRDISLDIDIGHSQEILSSLGQHKYDMVFSYFPVSHSHYDCLPYLKDHIALVTRPENNRFHTGITLRQVKELPFIYTDYMTIVDMDWFLPTGRMYPINLNIMSKAIPYLKDGDYYCFLPRELLLDELRAGKLIEIPIVDIIMPQKDSFIICKKGYEGIFPLNIWIEAVLSHRDAHLGA